MSALRALTRQQWEPLEVAHHARVDAYTQPYLARRSAGQPHPVEDFLFTYYTLKPAQLRRWHPGAGVILLDAEPERLGWKFYREPGSAELDAAGVSAESLGSGARRRPAAIVDSLAFGQQRDAAVAFSTEILRRTATNPASFGCFGLHEWAMVYRSEDTEVRHSYLPLRLGSAGTDEVVEGHKIRCTHFDAFRFYHPDAAPLNELTPTRENQRRLEQPGCLHANMDLYKWAYKLLPLISSAALMDCFDLAWRVREMDMRAAPYDLSGWGYSPIAIETPAGKAEYVALQRGFADDAGRLRAALLTELEAAAA